MCLSAFADDVTVNVPQSVQIGHPVEINVVFSGTGGNYTIGVRRLDGSHAFGGWGSSVGNRTEITETIWAENYLGRNSDITAGTYEAYCVWTKEDGSKAEGTKEFVMTGSVPVPPSFQSTSDSFHAAVGESFFLHGMGGSAVTLTIQIQRQIENGSTSVGNEGIEVQQDGTWSYSFLAEQAGAYRVFIYGYDADGYSTGSIDPINLYAEDETSLPAPAISTASTQVQAGYEGATFLFTTDTENVDQWMISVTSDDGKESWDGGFNPDDDGSKSFFYQFVYAGNYSVTAAYRCGGVWSASSTIAITATGTPRPSHGRIPFEVTIPREKLAGSNLAFSLATDAENASVSCQLSVKTGPHSNAGIYSFSMDSNGSAEIPGYYFEAGKNYTLNIYVSADDWMNGSRNIDFTAQENPDRDPAPAIVSMDPETAARRQPVTFTFDQTYAKLLCNVKPNNSTFFGIKEIVENTDQWVCNGSYFTSSEADEWILRVFAENNGVWSLPGELVFNVEAMPHLEAPVIVSAPSEVNLMSEFTVTVEPVENAQRYYLMLERYNETDDCYEWIGSTLSRSTAILFDDWSEDAEPGEYLVTVYAAADDYLDSASTQFTMTVIDAERPAAPVVTMTPGPYSDGNPVTFLLDRNYGEMRIYREMNGEDWGYTNESVYGSQVSLWLEPGEWTLRFQYKENGIWSELSQPVSLTVEEAPAAPEPVVESYPEEVHLFDSFTVVMTPQENVQSYYADLYQIDDTGKWTWRGEGDGETAIQVGYWADNSTPGNYVMRIIPNAEGYNNEGIYYDLYLTVLEERSDDERPAAPVLTLTQQNITSGDSFGYELDRSYGKFRLHREKDGQDYGYNEWDEAGNYLGNFNYAAGEWTVYGQYQEDGVWSAKSQPLTFTVTQTSMLPVPIVENYPTEVHLFDTITIVLTPQEEVERYSVTLYQAEGNSWYWRGNIRAEGPTIEFGAWSNDPTPGSYFLRIVSEAEGFDNRNRYIDVALTVLPPAESADARVFTLPGSLERIEAEAFEGSIATMFVIPEHCTAIESRAFANCRSLVRVVIPSSVRTIADDAFDGCYGLTIVTPAGSAADAYARARGWTVEND